MRKLGIPQTPSYYFELFHHRNMDEGRLTDAAATWNRVLVVIWLSLENSIFHPGWNVMENGMPRLAVLIDAENAQLTILPELLAEIAKMGTASVKRIYGDFTTPALAGWRDQLLAHSIQPIQQYRNTVHKNASDSALIIDAMDLLHSKKFDGFCIVSSDSDFTRLASRIREEGILAYGFGEQKTPKSFIAACDKFIYTEILRKPAQEPSQPEKPPMNLPGNLKDLVPGLRGAVESCADEGGWSFLGAVGQLLTNRIPDFDPTITATEISPPSSKPSNRLRYQGGEANRLQWSMCA